MLDIDFPSNPNPNYKLSPLAKLWILRILIRLHGHRNFVRPHDFENDHIADALGFGRMINRPDHFDIIKVREQLRIMHARAERGAGKARHSAVMEGNIARLSKMLGLSPVDCSILAFAVLIHAEDPLEMATFWLGPLSTTKLVRALAIILDLPARAVLASLGPQSLLTKSGLISVSRNCSGSMRMKLDLLSPSFADMLASERVEPAQLLRGTVSVAPRPELEMSDYVHLETSLGILQPYLKHALLTRRRGVNIAFHGPPGTGKTQLARLLSSKLKSKLFEVSSEDEDGDPVDGARRLRAFRAAQTLLCKQRAMILFDEVEDVFNDGSELFGRRSTAQTRKAWMNRILEDAAVPTFWLSNSIQSMDPAFIRRFDMIIEVPVPPRIQRQRIVQRACADLVDQKCIDRLSASEKLAPAVITRASSVLRAVGGSLGEQSAESALEHLIGNTLEAQGQGRLPGLDPCRLPETYDLAFLNPDADLNGMAEGLQRSRQGRICLYGPPGTGKTAFGRWLSQQLDIPLQVKRASDLLSPYLGMTEKNLAMAFRAAKREGALLMVDEVDSFLRDRKEAQRPWEATQVNEMLTQMESFPGIFIASTNLMDGLDPAALRRFDIKIRMDYLRQEQVAGLLRNHLACLGLGELSPEDEKAVRRLGNVAPGDYASISRRHRFRPITSAGEFVSLLESECRLKGEVRRPIGFVR